MYVPTVYARAFTRVCLDVDTGHSIMLLPFQRRERKPTTERHEESKRVEARYTAEMLRSFKEKMRLL